MLVKRILFFVLILLWGCKKNSDDRVAVQVTDLITNTPVKGISVYAYKCTDSDPFCGLFPWISATTGDDGKCSFLKSDFDIVTFVKGNGDNYWSKRTPK